MNDGTKSTECVQRIWETSSRVPIHHFSENLDDKVVEKGHNAGGGGIASFAKRNNHLAHASCRPSTHDYSFISFTGKARDEMNACLYPTHETFVHGNCLRIAHSHIYNHGHSYESISYNQSDGNESSYFRQHDGKYQFHHKKNDCDDASLSRRHYEVIHYGDHLSVRDEDSYSRRHYYDKRRNDNQQDFCDKASYAKHCQSDVNSFRHHDLKSLSSGYTTVEDSYTIECAELEYPAFPPECESIDGERKYYDIEHSFQPVLAVESEQSHQRTKNHDDRNYAYENIGDFQIFESYNENEQKRFCIGFDDNANKNSHSFDADYANVSYEGRGTSHKISTVPLFDDGLLMAFEEMQQL
jgi:hypothetical protein